MIPSPIYLEGLNLFLPVSNFPYLNKNIPIIHLVFQARNLKVILILHFYQPPLLPITIKFILLIPPHLYYLKFIRSDQATIPSYLEYNGFPWIFFAFTTVLLHNSQHNSSQTNTLFSSLYPSNTFFNPSILTQLFNSKNSCFSFYFRH